jgi:methylated-DNA-[protein]-cysteine S-methyltransferase
VDAVRAVSGDPSTGRVWWWRQPGPLGDVRVEYTAAGIRAVALPADPADDPPGAPRPRVGLARQLDAYFAGSGRRLDGALDLADRGLSPLQRAIMLVVRAGVPYGETATYGEVAELVGRPGAARAVGTAMARCPVPLLVPCHRVVAATGLGGFGGGPAGVRLKRALVDLEARGRPSA